MERDKLEAWADALLDQHRTAPKTEDRPAPRRATEADRMMRLMVEAGAAPATPDLMTYQRTETPLDPDAWVGKAQMMGAVLVGILVLSLVLALAVR
jgi:hypothetical protein